MIVILLGTQKYSFHRLLEEVQRCIDNGTIKQEVIVQAGGTQFFSKEMKIFTLIEQNELEKLIEKADIIRVGEKAFFYKDHVTVAMEALRVPCDELEMIVDKEMWPIPTYGELMFEV